MMDWYGGGMAGAGGFLGLLMILFWAALIGVIIYLVVRLLPGSGTRDRPTASAAASRGDSPEQVLDRVFALGEIDEETYRARRSAMIEMRGSS